MKKESAVAGPGSRITTAVLAGWALMIASGIFSVPAQTTIAIPPTIEEVVSNAMGVGVVRILSAQVYEPTDEFGVVPCPSIYTGEWIESFTGDRGSIRFVSDERFELDSKVLIFLTEKNLPRRLMSTNSLSENQRRTAEKRREACTLTKGLPFTTPHTSSRFFDDRHLADQFKTGTWLEYRNFFHNELQVTTIFPQSYNIDGEIIPRDVFLSQFFDEAKHGAIRSAGSELIIYRAVNWKEYRSRLTNLTDLTEAKEEALSREAIR